LGRGELKSARCKEGLGAWTISHNQPRPTTTQTHNPEPNQRPNKSNKKKQKIKATHLRR